MVWTMVIFMCLPYTIHITYRLVREKAIKRSVKAMVLNGIPEEDLVHLAFHIGESDSKIVWKEHAEFSYQNEMYDVVRTLQYGDSIHYFCWHDKEETQLKKHWRKLIRECIDVDPVRKQNKKKKADFENSLICFQIADLPDHFTFLHPKACHVFTCMEISGYQTCPKPPPRRIIS